MLNTNSTIMKDAFTTSHKKKRRRMVILIVILLALFVPFKRPARMAVCYDVMRSAEWTTPLLYILDVFIELGSCIHEESYDDDCTETSDGTRICLPAKPVIYLYPEQTTEVFVRLDYDGTIIADYPRYDKKLKGWHVIAHRDGTLINTADNREYSYLFWEGSPIKHAAWDFSRGFVVKGEDTREFLQKILAQIGLTPREYNEFIVYWYPRMKDHAYNLIHFAGKQYTDIAPLTIHPTPDAMLRVFMVYKPLKKPVAVTPQEIKPFVRKGFTVVEWGGMAVEN